MIAPRFGRAIIAEIGAWARERRGVASVSHLARALDLPSGNAPAVRFGAPPGSGWPTGSRPVSWSRVVWCLVCRPVPVGGQFAHHFRGLAGRSRRYGGWPDRLGDLPVRLLGVFQDRPKPVCSGTKLSPRTLSDDTCHYTMVVRFRDTRHRLQAETRRVEGKVCHEHVASLGSIVVPSRWPRGTSQAPGEHPRQSSDGDAGRNAGAARKRMRRRTSSFGPA
jgi:hypothetical protein